MALLSDKQQRNLLIALGLTDFATRSRLSTAAYDVVVATAKRIVPVTGRAAAGFVPRAAGTARVIAMRHPYIAAGAVLYVAVTEREKIRTLLEQGYDIVEEPGRQFVGGVEQRGREFISDPIGAIETQIAERERFSREFAAVPGRVLRKRKPSVFNKAVSAGMKAVKKSTSYGGKGKIKPAKKVFSMVAKLAAAKKKKKKAPKKGIRRLIWNAMKGLR
jgi:hypothetical protein